LLILSHLFTSTVLRFSELERAISNGSQKILIQQLRELERDGILLRIVHPQVPPKAEYVGSYHQYCGDAEYMRGCSVDDSAQSHRPLGKHDDRGVQFFDLRLASELIT
jgi:hypothetical protein